MTMKQTAMITGANSGIGLALTKILISKGWDVIALVRSDFPANDEAIKEALLSEKIHLYRADLSDLSSLKEALDLIKAKHYHIDVLFNNAGVSLDHYKAATSGRDIHFEVNTLSPYIITLEMKQVLLNGQYKMIVNTSSNALLHVKQFDPEKLAHPGQGSFKKLFGIYGASKLALSLWSQALSSTLFQEGLHIRSVDPGGNKTAMTAGAGMPTWLLLVRNLFFAEPSKGAMLLWSAAVDNPEIKTGAFLLKGKTVPLPYFSHAARILTQVEQIYKEEYLLVNA